MKTKEELASQDLRDVVRDGYAKVARGERTSCCGPASACGDSTTADDFARGVGYGAGEVSSLPEGAKWLSIARLAVAISSVPPSSIASRAREYSNHLLREGRSIGLSFHRRAGSRRRHWPGHATHGTGT